MPHEDETPWWTLICYEKEEFDKYVLLHSAQVYFFLSLFSCSASMWFLSLFFAISIAGLDSVIFQFSGHYKGILNKSIFQACRLVEGANSETWLAMNGVVVLLLFTLVLLGSASIYGSTADQKRQRRKISRKPSFQMMQYALTLQW